MADDTDPVWSPGDSSPPETTITSAVDGNNSPVADEGVTLSTSITFTFEGADNVGVASFECALDSAVFTPASCASPKTYNNLPVGGHTFEVRAIDASGNADPTTARFTWIIDLDSDGDGVRDSQDACPDTAPGASVDAMGCSQAQVDQDLDGVCDPGKVSTLCPGSDNCPTIPEDIDGFQDGDGCPERPPRAVVFIQGISSSSQPGDQNNCEAGIGFLDRAPRWLRDANLGRQGWIRANVTISDFVYFSYSGEYCGGGTGENGETLIYQAAHTCNGIDEVYVRELRSLIQRTVDRTPNTTVTILAHSMGGLITANLVATNADIRRHVASVVTFDSPLRGRPHIEQLPGFPGPCENDSPSVQDMRTDSEVVQRASTAAEVVPFYTWDATQQDRGFEFVPGAYATLNGARSGFPNVIPPLQIDDDHGSIWDCRFDESEGDCLSGGIDKAQLIGCAIILSLNCRFVRQAVAQGEAVTRDIVMRDAESARITASWQGSTVRLTLITPSGVRIDPSSLPPGASHAVGLNFESYELSNPESGTWTLELFGADVPPEGEDVIILLDIAEPLKPAVIAVSIDVKPGSDPNSINCNNPDEVITVAALTTQGFDATTLNHTTVSFEGATETHVDKKTYEPRLHQEDVDNDGDIDLVFHFRQGDTMLTCGSVEGTLTGETLYGQSIEGIDTVRMIN